MSCQVKICGLSEPTSLDAAVRAGADLVGFVHFPKSPRHVSLERAAELRALLPSHVMSVVVTVDPDDETVHSIIRRVNPDYIQLHGDESFMRLLELRQKIKIIKAIPVSAADDLIEMPAEILLFDAKPPKGSDLPGGNGITFDWDIMRGFQSAVPWMLSGGLTPENVAEAIAKSGAKMVDVSSGVELIPGVKDAGKIERFIKAAKQ